MSYPVELRPETDVVLGDLLRRLPAVLVGGDDPSRRLAPAELLHAIGTRVWHALIPGNVPLADRDAVAHCLHSTDSLLLLLPPALAVLPWELLCDPDEPNDAGFIARRRPLVRLISGGYDLSPLVPPLRVLLLISSPPLIEEHRRIDVESERAVVEEATRDLREHGLLHLRVEDIVTPQRVQQALLRFKPHVLHYIGHGGYQDGLGGFLEWEDDQGRPVVHPDARIADLLRPRGLRAVLLHGCETAAGDRHDDLTGVAGALVGAGVPAVVAQQYKLTYRSSQVASQAFYQALAANLGVGEAVFEARLALQQTDRPDWTAPIVRATVGGLMPLLDATAPPGNADSALAQQALVAGLPAPAGAFVGRQRELRALRRMLESAPGSGPVVTLITGPGGIGKSTLAAQALARYGRSYKAGLLLSCYGYVGVDLFLKDIGELLTRHGASGFLSNTLPDAGQSLGSKIRSAVDALNQAGPFLLVVDNLESVQTDDRTLADPGLLALLQALLFNLRSGRVLITGRYAVEGLVPDGKFQASLLRLDLDDLSRPEVRQLFARHALLATLDEAVVNELVEEFGGLPYVYDLLSSDAAAQDVGGLIFDIQQRKTAERAQRSAEEWKRVRNRAIEIAALEATLKRLPKGARDLLPRLTVFRRSFPLEALEQAMGAQRDEWQPLLDWALLRFDTQQRAYRLHSLTADYAAKLLDEVERRRWQVRVAEWYLLQFGSSNYLVDGLDAHALLREAQEAERAGELAKSLGEILERFGLYTIWSRLCQITVRECTGSIGAEAKRQLGIIAELQGQMEEARRLCDESLRLFEQLGDEDGRVVTLGQLGNVAFIGGEYEEARRLYSEAQLLAERLGNLRGLVHALYHLGVIAQTLRQHEEARRLYGEAQTLFKRLGDRGGLANVLHQLGNLAYRQKEFEEARQRYGESRLIRERLGNKRGLADTLHQLGIIAQDQGEYEEALRCYSESLSIRESLGDQRGQASALQQLGKLAQDQGQYEEARRLYGESLSIAVRLGAQPIQAAAFHQLGITALSQGQYEEARRFCGEAQLLFERLGDHLEYSSTLRVLGVIAQVQGQYEEARRLYGESLSISERLGDEDTCASTLYQLGVIARAQGQYEEARRLYGESLSIRESLGDQRGQASALQQLGKLAQDQGQYEEARRLYGESLSISDRLGDESACAEKLHQLGIIAYLSGKHAEARQLYGESLSIKERLGDRDGRAATLGLLGLLTRKEHDYPAALRYMVEALIIYESLGSPKQELARDAISALRVEMGEDAFTEVWQAHIVAVLPPNAPEEPPAQRLLDRVIALIKARSLRQAQRIIESDPEMLTASADALLVQFVALQPDEGARQTVEQYRALLARCREIGIEGAFAELQAATVEPEGVAAVAQLNALVNEVVATLRDGDMAQQSALAQRVARRAGEALPIEGADAFLLLLAGWLLGEDVAEDATQLAPGFRQAYDQIVAAVVAEDGPEDGMQRLLQDVFTLLTQGTALQRRQYAEQLDTLRGQLPQKQAALETFLACLSTALLGEEVDTDALEEPFTSTWRDLVKAVTQAASSEEEG